MGSNPVYLIKSFLLFMKIIFRLCASADSHISLNSLSCFCLVVILSFKRKSIFDNYIRQPFGHLGPLQGKLDDNIKILDNTIWVKSPFCYLCLVCNIFCSLFSLVEIEIVILIRFFSILSYFMINFLIHINQSNNIFFCQSKNSNVTTKKL